MASMLRFLPICLFACLVAALPARVHAQQVQRCVTPDGRSVYTDRRCDAIGAVDRVPPANATAESRRYRDGCPRMLSQLVGEIGAAIQARDVNRLAGIYDWGGISGKSAARVLNLLEQVVGQPLVDIAPVYAEYTPAAAPLPMPTDRPPPPAPAAQASDPAAWMPSWPDAQRAAPAAAATGAEAAGDEPPSPPHVRSRPVALRIEQTLAGSATPARTVFGLRRHYGCFWIAL